MQKDTMIQPEIKEFSFSGPREPRKADISVLKKEKLRKWIGKLRGVLNRTGVHRVTIGEIQSQPHQLSPSPHTGPLRFLKKLLIFGLRRRILSLS
jgi:hypothetical protein